MFIITILMWEPVIINNKNIEVVPSAKLLCYNIKWFEMECAHRNDM